MFFNNTHICFYYPHFHTPSKSVFSHSSPGSYLSTCIDDCYCHYFSTYVKNCNNFLSAMRKTPSSLKYYYNTTKKEYLYWLLEHTTMCDCCYRSLLAAGGWKTTKLLSLSLYTLSFGMALLNHFSHYLAEVSF